MSLLNSLAAVATRKQIAGTEKMVLLIKLTLFGFRALGAASAETRTCHILHLDQYSQN